MAFSVKKGWYIKHCYHFIIEACCLLICLPQLHIKPTIQGQTRPQCVSGYSAYLIRPNQPYRVHEPLGDLVNPGQGMCTHDGIKTSPPSTSFPPLVQRRLAAPQVVHDPWLACNHSLSGPRSSSHHNNV